MSLNLAILDAVENLDMALLSELSWAGGRSFPFAGSEDVTISNDTTWSDAVGYRKVRKLTIASGATLRIVRTPFFLFAEEIALGSTASKIDISGFDDDENPTQGNFARGGGRYGNSRGGDGGGLLILVVNTISGASGQIIANGGDGVVDGSVKGGGGGALSRHTDSDDAQLWSGTEPVGERRAYLHPLGIYMADGGGRSGIAGMGGGSGGGVDGGSGIGGGAAGGGGIVMAIQV